MAKYAKKHKTSDKSQQEASAIANGIKKPGQTKEQTKLVSQGIAKGIELYKKQQKAKSREQDKAAKKAARDKLVAQSEQPLPTEVHTPANVSFLPWLLLAVSWLGFIAYYFVASS